MLSKQNKTGKYLKYAIREVVLVVIGKNDYAIDKFFVEVVYDRGQKDKTQNTPNNLNLTKTLS